MLIDIGVNLTNSRFDKDRDDMLARAKSAHVEHMLITGTCLESSQTAITLAERYQLSSTAGIHPHDADGAADNFIEILRELSTSPYVKAIGECGLDFNRNFSTPANQQRVFEQQVQLAAELNMPLFLHQRDAFDTWMNILTPFVDTVPAMVSHCFTGDKHQLSRCLDQGMYIGITGWLCDKKRGQLLRDIVRYIPLDRLLIETDAPYLTPQNIRPKPKSSRNEPAYLSFVVAKLAECTQYSSDEISQHSTFNARKVFNLDE